MSSDLCDLRDISHKSEFKAESCEQEAYFDSPAWRLNSHPTAGLMFQSRQQIPASAQLNLPAKLIKDF